MTNSIRWTTRAAVGAAALCLLAPVCGAQASAVDAALAHYMMLLKSAPPESTAAFYTADGQLLEPGMNPLTGPAAIRAFLEPIARAVTVHEAVATPEATEVYGDSVGYQWGTYHQVAGPKDAPPSTYDGRFVIKWRSTPAGWRIVRFLVQPNPPPRR
jgi:ketosteroid isomerase-like protein